MSLFDQAFGELKNIDVHKSTQINALRWLASGVVWSVILFSGNPSLFPMMLIMPFSMGMAFALGIVARTLAKIGVPFAGLFEALMRLMLMAGDWLLNLGLHLFGEKIGLPYRFGWLNFTLILFVDREGEVKGAEDLAKSSIAQALNRKQ